ncbi:pilin [Patescibacteria group bacterium]|nr:pilin [Patescibacteria group bacterium]MCG2692717.1 pilin [Candidatus Parcubacteria bacterium]
MKFIKNRKLFLFLLTLFFVSVVFVPVCSADDAGLFKGIVNCRDTGDCSLNDFLQVFINASQWILGVVGSVALLMFVVGGVMWIFSGGNEQRITRGKQIIMGTVIGIALVLGGWLMISFLGKLLDVEEGYQLKEGVCADKRDGEDCGR